ncbi:H-NS histone family protein [Burkholderia sp. Ac-20353]|nr:H-NS histone family protein [Burkholderia sp. Ac-20353]
MANTDYKALKAQLEALHEKTEAARIAELEAVVADIRAKVAEYGIAAEQIFGRQRVAKGKKVGAHVAAKYQNPKTGETWSGRGRAPAWIKDVKDRSRFLIGAAAEAQSAAGNVAPGAAVKKAAAKKATAKTRKADAKSVKSAGATVARKKGRPSTSVVAAKKTRSRRVVGVKKAAGTAAKPEIVTEAASE